MDEPRVSCFENIFNQKTHMNKRQLNTDKYIFFFQGIMYISI